VKQAQVGPPSKFPCSSTDRFSDTLPDGASTEAAPLNKRRKQGPVSGRYQVVGTIFTRSSFFQPNSRPGPASHATSSNSAPSNNRSKRAADTTRTGRGQIQFSQDRNSTSDGDEDPECTLTTSSSSLSDPPSSDPEAAQPQVFTRGQPQQNFAIPPKSQLAQREVDEAKAAHDNEKNKAQKMTVSAQPQEPQRIQNRFQLEAELDAKNTVMAGAKRKRTDDVAARRELEKQQKAAELERLDAKIIPAPLPYRLQLPTLAPRQNHTGRSLKLNLVAGDPTFPLTPRVRELFVSFLMDAMRDCRVAQDKVALTTNYWHVWLKPVHEGRYTYEEIDMERVCRKLINIAEALHAHGLGATDIYCPETIRKAMTAQPMLFENRISKLGALMRKTKARCNEFMLGNTLEDTVALIDLKVSDQKSNNANNHMRSVKIEQTNKFLQVPKGSKWPKDKKGRPLKHSDLVALGYFTPDGMMVDGVKDEHDAVNDGSDSQPATAVHQLPHPAPASTHQHEGPQGQKPNLDWLAEWNISHTNLTSPFLMPNVEPLEAFSPTYPRGAFEGYESGGSGGEHAYSNIWQPPVGSEPFTPMSPALIDPALNIFDGGPASSASGGFDNFSVGNGQQMGPYAGMPSPYDSDMAFAGLWEIPQGLQTGPAYYTRPEAQQAFVSDGAEHELLKINRHTSGTNPVKPVAEVEESREIGEGQDEGVIQPVNKRARRGKLDPDSSKERQGVSTNSLLRTHTARPSAKHGSKRQVSKVYKSGRPIHENLTSSEAADAEND
jgi:hypothetical protein